MGAALKSELFDADQAWSRLTSLAESYFWNAKAKQEEMPSAKRVARLLELAKALGHARTMIDRAMQDQVGDLLRASWWEGTNGCAKVDRFFQGYGDGRYVDVQHKFKRVVETEVARLAALEAAATRAAVPTPETYWNRNFASAVYRGNRGLCIEMRLARSREAGNWTICQICYGISDRAGSPLYRR